MSALTRVLTAGCLLSAAGCLSAAELSERDYYTDLPEVLTVTRLAQPISETPGAVTIIDRDTIRRSGARELTEVMRLVPGYVVGGFNGANPVAAYHAPLDSNGTRNLVLIDGRPVYSVYYLGDTHFGMMGVMLEDIERIEVLRGANSAAYGANAMFGVINIITRHTADTRGAEVALSVGNGGVNDNRVRIGWGDETASFRISAGRRSDSGYVNANDDKIVSQMHLRADLRPAENQELMLSSGVVEHSYGDGFPYGSPRNSDGGNPTRTAGWRDFYLHGSWTRQISGTDQVKLTASYDEENFSDSFVYVSDPSVTVSTNGRGRRLNLELQHQLAILEGLRAVWGVGYKYEDALSPALYARSDAVSLHEERLFGSLEWRPHPQWLINAGGFMGNHSWSGSYFTPRLMANFEAIPDHTFRIGVTDSARQPTLFELAGNLQLYPKNILGKPLTFPVTKTSQLFPWFAFFNMPMKFVASSGTVTQEKLASQEVGYFGNFREWRLTVDLRGYLEDMRDLIGTRSRAIPGYFLPLKLLNPLLPNYPIPVTDYVNSGGLAVRGFEYQLRWKPLADTEIWLNQSFQRVVWDNAMSDIRPPSHTATVALLQRLPGGIDFSLMYHSQASMAWGTNASDVLPSSRRIDARVAYPFRIGSTKAEAAVTVQQANGGQAEYLKSYGFQSQRRAFGTLRLEY